MQLRQCVCVCARARARTGVKISCAAPTALVPTAPRVNVELSIALGPRGGGLGGVAQRDSHRLWGVATSWIPVDRGGLELCGSRAHVHDYCRQKRPTNGAKETCYRGKRDLL